MLLTPSCPSVESTAERGLSFSVWRASWKRTAHTKSKGSLDGLGRKALVSRPGRCSPGHLEMGGRGEGSLSVVGFWAGVHPEEVTGQSLMRSLAKV